MVAAAYAGREPGNNHQPGLLARAGPANQNKKMSNHIRSRTFKSIIVASGLLVPCLGLLAQPADQVLSTAKAVRSLSAADAERHIPVKLHGVVTFYDETLFSRFLQDETAGIYFSVTTNMPPLVAGQEVELEGVSGPGEYAPVVLASSVKIIGAGKFPAARPVSLEQLVSGQVDSQLVEFSGVVRAVYYDKDNQFYIVDFVTGGDRFSVYAKKLPVAQPQDLVDSTVKVRGVCATMFNHQRQLFGVRVLVPEADGLFVERAALASPYDLPLSKISSLLQFTPEGSANPRVKVTGTVVYAEPGSAIGIQDATSGLFCQTLQRDAVQLGDQVEVLGFPAKGEYTPILQDCIFRKIGSGAAPKADAVDVNEILTGTHDCRLVQMPARVLDRVERGVNRFLLLQSSDFTFQAYLPQRQNNDELAAIQNGSEVLVTGLCLIERGNHWQAGEKWRAASFHLLLRSPKDVSFVQGPATIKSPDELLVAVVAGAIAIGALLWVAVLKMKLRRSAQS